MSLDKWVPKEVLVDQLRPEFLVDDATVKSFETSTYLQALNPEDQVDALDQALNLIVPNYSKQGCLDIIKDTREKCKSGGFTHCNLFELAENKHSLAQLNPKSSLLFLANHTSNLDNCILTMMGPCLEVEQPFFVAGDNLVKPDGTNIENGVKEWLQTLNVSIYPRENSKDRVAISILNKTMQTVLDHGSNMVAYISNGRPYNGNNIKKVKDDAAPLMPNVVRRHSTKVDHPIYVVPTAISHTIFPDAIEMIAASLGGARKGANNNLQQQIYQTEALYQAFRGLSVQDYVTFGTPEQVQSYVDKREDKKNTKFTNGTMLTTAKEIEKLKVVPYTAIYAHALQRNDQSTIPSRLDQIVSSLRYAEHIIDPRTSDAKSVEQFGEHFFHVMTSKQMLDAHKIPSHLHDRFKTEIINYYAKSSMYNIEQALLVHRPGFVPRYVINGKKGIPKHP